MKKGAFSVKEAEITTPLEVTVTGMVLSSEDNLPLPNVSVVVKGTSTGTTTDFDGNYRVNVLENGTLVFSYIGKGMWRKFYQCWKRDFVCDRRFPSLQWQQRFSIGRNSDP